MKKSLVTLICVSLLSGCATDTRDGHSKLYVGKDTDEFSMGRTLLAAPIWPLMLVAYPLGYIAKANGMESDLDRKDRLKKERAPGNFANGEKADMIIFCSSYTIRVKGEWQDQLQEVEVDGERYKYTNTHRTFTSSGNVFPWRTFVAPSGKTVDLTFNGVGSKNFYFLRTSEMGEGANSLSCYRSARELEESSIVTYGGGTTNSGSSGKHFTSNVYHPTWTVHHSNGTIGTATRRNTW